MVWFKVDDTLPFHAKVVAAGNPAMGLWVRAGAWSAQQLTDGFIPDHMIDALGTKGQANRLAIVGLWRRGEREGVSGFEFHQWNEDGRQPTRESVEKERSEARERMRKAREAKRDKANGSDEVRANTGRSSGDVRSTPTRPDPTRPDPSLEENSIEGGSHVSSGAADEPPLYPDRCSRHGNTYEPGDCGHCADARKANLRFASIGPHNPATKPHCGECDETRMLRTRFGAIPCPNCNPAAEEAS